MNPELVCRALAAIGPETNTFEQFHLSSGILSSSVAKSTLGFLEANGIGKVSGRAIHFSASDKLKAALLVLQTLRCDIEQVSRLVSWKDFEGLAAEVLKSLGYATQS
ncbi:MAG: hypothetical protein MN733_07335, partial [Nitrososphaera sp.]|nr:hypothetical protein [Nitrososphaera sp.]